jgi:hypothetical protein
MANIYTTANLSVFAAFQKALARFYWMDSMM